MARMGRRDALKRVGLGAVGVGALAIVGATPAAAGEVDAIVGTWSVTFRQTHPKPDHLEALLAFAGGGAMVEADGSAQSPSLGTWRRAGDGAVFSFKSWGFNPNGTVFGTFHVDCKATVDAVSMEGAFRITVFDTSGVVIFTGRGTLDGTRFKASSP